MRAITYRGAGRQSLWKKATDIESAELRALNSAVPASEEDRREWDLAVKEISDEFAVILVVFPFRPYRLAHGSTDSRLRVAWTEGEAQRFEPLTQRSAIVEALYEAWQRSLQVIAFAPRVLPDEHTFATLKTAVIRQLTNCHNYEREGGEP